VLVLAAGGTCDGNAIRTVTKVDDGYPSHKMTVAVSIWDASWATGPVARAELQ